VSSRLARIALRAYPLAFRRRYEAEMLALLDEAAPRASTVLDLLRGAISAHLRPLASLEDRVAPGERIRASTTAVLACWVALAAAGFGFYKTTEDAPFAGAARAHWLLAAAHVAVQALAVAGSAAVMLGALPLIASALMLARRDRRVRRLVLVPVGSVVLFGVLTALLVVLATARPMLLGHSAARGVFVAWQLAALACAAICVVGVRNVLFAIGAPAGRLLAAHRCGIALSATMIAIAIATTLYAIALPLDAAHLSAAVNGPLGLLSTGAAVVEQALVMSLAAALAVVSARRGRRAAGRMRAGLDAPPPRA
jgi:hypothetical protein